MFAYFILQKCHVSFVVTCIFFLHVNQTTQTTQALGKYNRFNVSHGHTRQLYLGKSEVSLEKVAFFRVTNFTLGKFIKVNLPR